MIDRLEYKMLDKLSSLSNATITKATGCKVSEIGDILTGYFKHRKKIARVNLHNINTLESLYSVKYIHGDFKLNDCKPSSDFNLGELKMVHGSIFINNVNLTNTGNLMYCEGLTL